MESDIVERLRGAATKDYGCQCPKCEAADEIERLRAELAAAIKQRDEARREACLFEVIADFNKKYPTGCMTSELARRLARIVADEKEWDCFAKKEGGCA